MKRLCVFLLLALLILMGCSATATGPAIDIGLVVELTGDIPAVGASSRQAAELAVNEVNKSGGILVNGIRHKINLITVDNQGDARTTADVVEQLAALSNVMAVVGPNASRYAIPAAEAAELHQIPLITPWSTSPKTTLDPTSGAPRRYVFRACFIDAFQGQVIARFALETLGARTAAVLYDSASEYNRGIAEIFRETFATDGSVVAFESYLTGDMDWERQFTAIQAANPDIIFLPNYYTEVPLQIQQAQSMGITAPFIGSDTWGSIRLLEACGAACNGYYFSTHFAADIATLTARRFIKAYQFEYGEVPDDVAALTYDAFGLLWTAFRNAGVVNDREALTNALATIPTYEGVTGNLQFQDSSGDPIKTVVIVKIENGEFIWYANANP